MKFISLLLVLCLTHEGPRKKIVTFSSETNLREWRIVNDGVMGGVSSSTIRLSPEGHGVFSGQVSLAYNGGFASVQWDTAQSLTPDQTHVVLRVKGDGKRYEFRLKSTRNQPESYVQPFLTNGQWQEIRLPLKDFYPQCRGRMLAMPNFNFDRIAQISFLIANKQEEDFTLLIDWIALE